MGIWFSLCAGLILQAAQAVAGGAAPGYTQSYVILIRGAVAGSETVSEKTDAAGDRVCVSEHDLILSDGLEAKRMAFTTRMVRDRDTLAPKSYRYEYADGVSGDFYEVVIQGNQATRTLKRSGVTNEVAAPFGPDTVLLDFNVYHQYDYLIRKYDMKKGGRQVFSDFVPLIGRDIPMAVTYQGESSLETEKAPVPVRNFQVEFVGISTGRLSADRDGRLVRLILSSQDLEVVRKDVFSQSPDPALAYPRQD
jgi:hypothetical protein